MKNKEVNLAQIILKKLQTFQKMGCEIEITLIQKTGDSEQLGICDVGEYDNVTKSKVKVIPMTLASEKGAAGEISNNMELGNNAEKYFEFAEIAEQAEQSNIHTGDRVLYQKEEYIVFEILPVVMGETLLCRQYKAKKVL
ncbi:hypothetical protein AAK894_14565 [Lachnospiraceae bacterium 46-61]